VDVFLYGALNNAAWAAALAVSAAVGGRLWRSRPALVHALWVLVLLKLATPSLVHVAWPRGTRPSRVGPAVVRPSPPGDFARPASRRETEGSLEKPAASALSKTPATPTARHRSSTGQATFDVAPLRRHWRVLALGVWLAGVGAWWSALGLSAARFRRLVRAARPAPAELGERVGRLSARLGVPRPPAVGIVPARVPPMLWALAGPPRLLLPEDLWGRLDADQQDAVLAHELAHLRRRDHWVRRLEALVLGLYWWDPFAWWARREVERAEEPCCDAWVVWALPGSAGAYAEALVATATFLSGPHDPLPAGASGAGCVTLLKRRLSMILGDPTSISLARRAPRAALLLGLLALPLLPALTTGGSTNATAQAAAAPKAETPRARDEAPKAEVPKAVGEVPRAEEPGGPARKEPRADGKVAVCRPIVREVSDYLDFTGRTEAAQSVEIRPRVGGMLTKVVYPSGKMVKEGDLLFEIDPRPYQAELDKAEAEVRRAEARLKRWSTEWELLKKLHQRGAVSQDEIARVEGERDEAAATLEAAKASLSLAKLNLDYTRITAPLDGQLSRALLSAGNIVAANATRLATIITLDPMSVVFDVDESSAQRIGRGNKQRGDMEMGYSVLVGVAEEGFPHRGKVEASDIEFDPSKGTVRWHAVIPNPDRMLLPGLFARVRLITSAPHKALLVPEKVVINGSTEVYVHVVSDRNVVEYRHLWIGLRHEGLVEVKEGLTEKDRVIISKEAKPGTAVEPEEVPTSP
jgi:RND family efflux transporter MFP subunit